MFKKTLSLIVIFCFFLTSLGPMPQARADAALGLPAPGTMVNLSPAYEPVMIKGLTVHKDNPFLFDFIVDVGQDRMAGEPLKREGEKLIKYFLASLAIPDKDVWVNLSPYEKDRTIPEALGKTDMGRDLLEQDYILKQITASLIYPEKQLGKTFWNTVYAKAQQQYGTTQIPVNTFNKVWIMADRAEVFEHNQTAFVVDSHLKVMLEEDYLALAKNQRQPGDVTLVVSPSPLPSERGLNAKASQGNNQTHSISSQMIKQIILPELEKEVNTGKNFANLRQIFNSIILSSWYKKNLKQALLNLAYADRSKVKGIDINDPTVKEQIYEQYLKAYKKGVFNYIREDVNAAGEMIPKKYFSGGMAEGAASPAMLTIEKDVTRGSFKLGRAMKTAGALVLLTAGLLSAAPVSKNTAVVINKPTVILNANKSAGKAEVSKAEKYLSNGQILTLSLLVAAGVGLPAILAIELLVKAALKRDGPTAGDDFAMSSANYRVEVQITRQQAVEELKRLKAEKFGAEIYSTTQDNGFFTTGVKIRSAHRAEFDEVAVELLMELAGKPGSYRIRGSQYTKSDVWNPSKSETESTMLYMRGDYPAFGPERVKMFHDFCEVVSLRGMGHLPRPIIGKEIDPEQKMLIVDGYEFKASTLSAILFHISGNIELFHKRNNKIITVSGKNERAVILLDMNDLGDVPEQDLSRFLSILLKHFGLNKIQGFQKGSDEHLIAVQYPWINFGRMTGLQQKITEWFDQIRQEIPAMKKSPMKVAERVNDSNRGALRDFLKQERVEFKNALLNDAGVYLRHYQEGFTVSVHQKSAADKPRFEWFLSDDYNKAKDALKLSYMEGALVLVVKRPDIFLRGGDAYIADGIRAAVRKGGYVYTGPFGRTPDWDSIKVIAAGATSEPKSVDYHRDTAGLIMVTSKDKDVPIIKIICRGVPLLLDENNEPYSLYIGDQKIQVPYGQTKEFGFIFSGYKTAQLVQGPNRPDISVHFTFTYDAKQGLSLQVTNQTKSEVELNTDAAMAGRNDDGEKVSTGDEPVEIDHGVIPDDRTQAGGEEGLTPGPAVENDAAMTGREIAARSFILGQWNVQTIDAPGKIRPALAKFVIEGVGTSSLSLDKEKAKAVEILVRVLSRVPASSRAFVYTASAQAFFAHQDLFIQFAPQKADTLKAGINNVLSGIHTDPLNKKYVWGIDIDRDDFRRVDLDAVEQIVEHASVEKLDDFTTSDLPVIFAVARYKGKNERLLQLGDNARVKVREFAYKGYKEYSEKGNWLTYAPWLSDVVDLWGALQVAPGKNNLKNKSVKEWLNQVTQKWQDYAYVIDREYLLTMANLAVLRAYAAGDAAMAGRNDDGDKVSTGDEPVVTDHGVIHDDRTQAGGEEGLAPGPAVENDAAMAADGLDITAEFVKVFDEKIGNFTFTGRPGAGKGEQSTAFINKMNTLLPAGHQIETIVMGDYFRGIERIIKKIPKPGDQEKYGQYIGFVGAEDIKLMNDGEMMRDETAFRIVTEILKEPRMANAKHIFFDGFPRSRIQWNGYRHGKIFLRGEPLVINFFLDINLPREETFARAARRNRDANDLPEAVERRQNAYEKSTGLMVEDIEAQAPELFRRIESDYKSALFEDRLRNSNERFMKVFYAFLGVPVPRQPLEYTHPQDLGDVQGSYGAQKTPILFYVPKQFSVMWWGQKVTFERVPAQLWSETKDFGRIENNKYKITAIDDQPISPKEVSLDWRFASSSDVRVFWFIDENSLVKALDVAMTTLTVFPLKNGEMAYGHEIRSLIEMLQHDSVLFMDLPGYPQYKMLTRLLRVSSEGQNIRKINGILMELKGDFGFKWFQTSDSFKGPGDLGAKVLAAKIDRTQYKDLMRQLSELAIEVKKKDFAMNGVQTLGATAAYSVRGGIDLNTSNGMRWKVRKDGNGVEMDIDPAMIERVKREGKRPYSFDIDSLTPIILKISPIASIWSLAGLQAPVHF